MRRTLLLVVLMACATPAYEGADAPLTVVIEDWNPDAVAVRIRCTTNRELGRIFGLTFGETTTEEMQLRGCRWVHYYVDLVGRRLYWRSLMPTDVQPGDRLEIRLEEHLNTSVAWVRRSAGYDLGLDSLLVVGLQGVEPRAIHAGIWKDVEWCLGQESEMVTQWGVAERLIDPRDGTLAYGATVFNDDGTPLAILIERGWWLSSQVVSHEIVHAITRDASEDSEAMIRCQMRVPVTLPRRAIPPDSVAFYRDLLARSQGG